MCNTVLLESVGENFDVNFVMKEFPDKKTKHKRRVVTEEMSSAKLACAPCSAVSRSL
jgi:hypothetical protein